MGRNGFEDEEYTHVAYLEYIEFERTKNLRREGQHTGYKSSSTVLGIHAWNNLQRRNQWDSEISFQNKTTKDETLINIF